MHIFTSVSFRGVHATWKYLVDKLPHTARPPLEHEIEIIDGYILTPRGQRVTVGCMYTCGHLVAVHIASKTVYFLHTVYQYKSTCIHTQVLINCNI